MKKQYLFTKDSSFTHVKDKMYHSATEHVIEDDRTKKLYHLVVSYGSWFKLGYDDVFMSHLFKEIGITGFEKSYVADDCDIVLPWYPGDFYKQSKAIVELPDDVKLGDFEFGVLSEKISEEYQQTFLGKSFIIQDGDSVHEYSAQGILSGLFGYYPYIVAHIKKEDSIYPLSLIISSSSMIDKSPAQMVKVLSRLQLDKHSEILTILDKFSKIDLDRRFCDFKEEVGKDCEKLQQDLHERQAIIKRYLASEQVDERCL